MGVLRSIFAAEVQHRRMSAESEANRRRAAQKRLAHRKQQAAEAEQAVTTFNRYVRGQTGAELVRAVKNGSPMSPQTYERLSPGLQETWRKAVARQERSADELREIADEMGFLDVYVFGKTPAEIRRQRRQAKTKARREDNEEWLEGNRGVLAEEVRKKTPWWRFTDDEYEKAERRALRRRQRRNDPDSDFEED